MYLEIHTTYLQPNQQQQTVIRFDASFSLYLIFNCGFRMSHGVSKKF